MSSSEFTFNENEFKLFNNRSNFKKFLDYDIESSDVLSTDITESENNQDINSIYDDIIKEITYYQNTKRKILYQDFKYIVNKMVKNPQVNLSVYQKMIHNIQTTSENFIINYLQNHK
uniref:Uncharacterized protein n=1 Tax=viral metagenome TaxID=1070528 RepID=A0A6C0M2M6_9ZZZZ